ncbi:MAG: BlaI/MecI/CopY family transcriptional regulator [Firmicutes bacterium]|nr:BlaI/MecI/CopY family transcriptional regulator [Bacillota bacterium]
MRISDSEMEIMDIIWESEGEVTSAGIAKKLDTDWSGATVRTFLKRLTAKGILKMRREGKTNYYTPTMNRGEYRRICTEDFINDMHSGSVKNMLAALYGGEKPSADEIKEIKDWFESL